MQAVYATNDLVQPHFRSALREALSQFTSDTDWTHDSIHHIIRQLPKSLDKEAESVPGRERIKKASILTPIRFAVSARTTGPSLADILISLGKEETLARLRLALEAHKAGMFQDWSLEKS